MVRPNPPHTEIYAQEMAREAPEYGYALWDPEPVDYGRVCIGDIGYIRHGIFHRIGNTIDGTSPDMPRLEVGQSSDEPYGKLVHRDRPALHLRASMTETSGAGIGAGVDLNVASVGVCFKFESDRRTGASLLTHGGVVSEDSHSTKPSREYMRDTAIYRRWESAAEHWDTADRCSDIFIVTGCHLAKEWAVTAFYNRGQTRKAEVQFQPGIIAQGSLSFWGEWKTEGPVHTNCGPPRRDGRANDTADQSVFLRRVVRKEREQWLRFTERWTWWGDRRQYRPDFGLEFSIEYSDDSLRDTQIWGFDQAACEEFDAKMDADTHFVDPLDYLFDCIFKLHQNVLAVVVEDQDLANIMNVRHYVERRGRRRPLSWVVQQILSKRVNKKVKSCVQVVIDTDGVASLEWGKIDEEPAEIVEEAFFQLLSKRARDADTSTEQGPSKRRQLD